MLTVRSAALAALLLPLVIAPVRAQRTDEIRMLDRALPLVRWDTERQGALLAVDPGAVARLPETMLPVRSGDGYSLRTVAAVFDRKAVSLATVTALVPTTMVVLNTHPGKPDFLAMANREDRLRLLLASLSAPQWQKITSPGGIGPGDLTETQQPYFDLCLPDPFHIADYKAGTDVDLTPEERARVRLRLDRQTLLRCTASDNSVAYRFDNF